MKKEEGWKNQLWYGDNLDVLRKIPNDYVDLIYLDPPFNSNASYNMLFKEKDGKDSQAQVEAFTDSWEWVESTNYIFEELTMNEEYADLANLINSLERFLGKNALMAYLVMMAVRLIELHRVLKATGSLYLHCDPTASHYIKLILDAVFGHENFKREIIWSLDTVSGFKTTALNWIRTHDTIMYYVKNIDKYMFNKQYLPHKPEYIARFKKSDESGRLYRDDRSGGRIQYLDETPGRLLGDVWTDIMSFQQASTSKEIIGYATQKPEGLLERIIKASSNEGDLILDPFCGCGTTIAVAERLKRRWIGIDITWLSVDLMERRLKDAFAHKYISELAPYEVKGAPQDLASAIDLANRDKYQFQFWAVTLIGARPYQDGKRGPDTGIDGIRYFKDQEVGGQRQTVIVQVKGGKHVSSPHIRDLSGVLTRENAAIGVYICLTEPTDEMIKEKNRAGLYKTPTGKMYPKIQILTIEDILVYGKNIEIPFRDDDGHAAFKRATSRTKDDNQSGQLF